MSDPPRRRTALIVIAALMLLHVAAYPFATVLLDTSRDLSQAWAIVEGATPLLGPRIDDRFHLGPLWFYLLALPLASTKSVAATLSFVGLLAALKFPLAYACGKRLFDARFGLLWAVALVLPGWNALQSMFPTHTNLVETMMLAALLPLIRLWQLGDSRWWMAFGLLFGLAFHAHPTVLVMLPLAIAVAWRRRDSWRGEIAPMLGGVALAVLPFAPMLMHEAAQGWPMFGTLFKASDSNSLTALAGAWKFMVGAQMFGALAALAPLGFDKGAVPLAIWFAGMPLLACVFAYRPGLRMPREAWGVPLAAVLAWLLLAALRERTPFYMVYAWLPFAACVTALGWWQLWRLPRGRALALAIAGSVVVGALAVTTLQMRDAHRGLTPMAGNVADVRKAASPRPLPLLPAFLLDHWGREICAQERDVVLHGDLALLVDAALAMPVRMVCDRAERVHIGGGAGLAGAWHVLGLTPGQRHALHGSDGGWPQAFSEGPLRVVAAARTTPVASGGLLSLRPRSGGEQQVRELEFDAPRGAAVLIGLPLAPYDEARIGIVSADGVVQAPVLSGATSRVYRCDDCSGEAVAWRIAVSTREPERLDVVLLTPAAAASRD